MKKKSINPVNKDNIILVIKKRDSVHGLYFTDDVRVIDHDTLKNIENSIKSRESVIDFVDDLHIPELHVRYDNRTDTEADGLPEHIWSAQQLNLRGWAQINLYQNN